MGGWRQGRGASGGRPRAGCASPGTAATTCHSAAPLPGLAATLPCLQLGELKDAVGGALSRFTQVRRGGGADGGGTGARQGCKGLA